MKILDLKDILLCYMAATVTINLYCLFSLQPHNDGALAEKPEQAVEQSERKTEDGKVGAEILKNGYFRGTEVEDTDEFKAGEIPVMYSQNENSGVKVTGSDGADIQQRFVEVAEQSRGNSLFAKMADPVFIGPVGEIRDPAVSGMEITAAPDVIFSLAPRMNSQHLFGRSEARFSLYVYSDFSCAFCRNIFRPLLELVRDSHGEINLVFRHFPLTGHGAQTLLRSVLSECYGRIGGNRKFWIAASMLYETADYRGINEILKISEDELTDCIRHSDPVGRVRSDVLEGRILGIVSTPSVVIEDLDSGNRILATGITDVSHIKEEVQRLKRLPDGSR